MATREDISFVSKHHPYIFLEKLQSFKKNLVSFQSYAPKTTEGSESLRPEFLWGQGGGWGGGSSERCLKWGGGGEGH